MSMITWSDVDRAEAEGPQEVKGYTVILSQEHIDRWKEDPDGRFKLAEVDGAPGTAELGQFFPSL